MAIPLSEGSPERRDGDDAKETAAKYYKVIHKHAVAVHETMSLASAAVSFKQPGLVIRGIATDEGAEHDWVRLASGEGYVLANHPTDGKLLETLEPATFKVAHKAVLVRREPSTSSKVLQIKKEGDLLLVDGHLEGWLKVHGVAQDEESSSPLALGWVMIHHQTYGKLVQYLKGEVPTFGDDCAQDGSISATPSSVYTGKTADPLTERLRVELESLRQTVDEKERTSERDAARGDTYDLLRRGLMANAGQSASGSFCVGGNPL